MAEQYATPTPPTGPGDGTPGGPVPGQRRGTLLRHPAVTGALGLLLGLATVGIPVLVGGGDDGSAVGATSGGTLRAPADLKGFTSYADMQRTRAGNASGRAYAGQIAAEDARSGQRLSAAYGGANAVVQRYTDDTLANFVTLVAVRSDSPKPYVPFEDPAYTKAAVPQDQLVTVGKVSCVVFNIYTAAGKTPAADSVNTSYCQRTGGGLTIQIRAGSGPLLHSPDKVAQLVEAAWSDLP